MKTCLLCNHQERGNRGPDPEIPFICSTCIQTLARTDIKDLTARYLQAIDEGRYGVAYALHSFVPKALRKKFEYLPDRNTGYRT